MKYIYVYVYIYKYMYIDVHTPTHTHTHTHIYVYVYSAESISEHPQTEYGFILDYTALSLCTRLFLVKWGSFWWYTAI